MAAETARQRHGPNFSEVEMLISDRDAVVGFARMEMHPHM
jgi:hypothetical protein